METTFPISRRALLVTTAVVATGLTLGGATVMGTSNAFAATSSAADFLGLSTFLTGKTLDLGLATRYQAALSQHDPKFNDSASALQRFVADAKVADIDALMTLPTFDDALRKTVKQIVSAWYLGIVGTDANAQLISYANALMYYPTKDVLVIPSYGGGPGSWGEKPANLSVVPNEKKKQ